MPAASAAAYGSSRASGSAVAATADPYPGRAYFAAAGTRWVGTADVVVSGPAVAGPAASGSSGSTGAVMPGA